MGPPPSSSGTLLKIRVTLWKNYVIRRHHWLLSLCEVALPALLFAFFAYMRATSDGIAPRYVNTTTYTQTHSVDELLRLNSLHPCTFLYAPNTTFADALMGDVRIELEISDDGKRGGVNCI